MYSIVSGWEWMTQDSQLDSRLRVVVRGKYLGSIWEHQDGRCKKSQRVSSSLWGLCGQGRSLLKGGGDRWRIGLVVLTLSSLRSGLYKATCQQIHHTCTHRLTGRLPSRSVSVTQSRSLLFLCWRTGAPTSRNAPSCSLMSTFVPASWAIARFGSAWKQRWGNYSLSHTHFVLTPVLYGYECLYGLDLPRGQWRDILFYFFYLNPLHCLKIKMYHTNYLFWNYILLKLHTH